MSSRTYKKGGSDLFVRFRVGDCREWKPIEEFPRSKNSKDGRHRYCKACNNARSRESRERLHEGTRHYHLKQRYGVGADEFDRLVAEQHGVCVICGRDDHECGRVRGILCFNCNGGLGQFRDDADALRRAADYVESGNFHDERALGDVARARAGLLRVGAV